MNNQAKSVKCSVETNIGDVEEQRKQQTSEIKHLQEDVISKVNTLFQNIQSETSSKYQSQNSHLNENKEKILDIITRTEEHLNETKKLKGKPIDTKLFLKIQEHIKTTNQTANDLRNLNESRHLISLSFDQSKLAKDIMADSATLGSAKKIESKPDAIDVNDVTFPQSISQSVQSPPLAVIPKAKQHSPTTSSAHFTAADVSDQLTAERQLAASSHSSDSIQPLNQQSESRQHRGSTLQNLSNQQTTNTAGNSSTLASVALSQIKTTKQNSSGVGLKDDAFLRRATGMAITKYKRRLLVDNSNKKSETILP